jgi:phosphoglucosamine mutase
MSSDQKIFGTDGLNINQDCGSLFPDHLCRLVKDYRVDVGIAHDSDADRFLMCDHDGNRS